MAQFDVYKTKAGATVPLVVDVQADLLKDLRTRVIIPLLPRTEAGNEITAPLKPIVDITGKPHVLITTDLSAVPTAALGEWVASIEPKRHVIVDALDFVFQGF